MNKNCDAIIYTYIHKLLLKIDTNYNTNNLINKYQLS
jgi:hypothetical protein